MSRILIFKVDACGRYPQNTLFKVVAGCIKLFHGDLGVAMEELLNSPKGEFSNYGIEGGLEEALKLMPPPEDNVAQQVVMGASLPSLYRKMILRDHLPELQYLSPGMRLFYESHSGATAVTLWYLDSITYVVFDAGDGFFSGRYPEGEEDLSRLRDRFKKFLMSERTVPKEEYRD